MTRPIGAQLKDRPSQGGKSVQCVACKGEIPPYAGRQVSLIGNRYAHQAGQCADAGARTVTVRDLARQGELFGWACRKVEPAAETPVVCDETGTDRAAYAAHMAAHGLKATGTDYRPVRLRKTVPAAKLAKPSTNPLKFITWHETKLGEWQAGIGNPIIGEADRRGQYWSEADHPHSIWVVPLEPAPWEPEDQPAKPVQLYSHGDGHWSTDWSAAKWARRGVNQRAKNAKVLAS